MTSGIILDRHLIVVLEDGSPILDWDEGLGIDLLKGQFVRYQVKGYSHVIQDDELEFLKKAGSIISYDSTQVVVAYLPEVPSESEVG